MASIHCWIPMSASLLKPFVHLLTLWNNINACSQSSRANKALEKASFFRIITFNVHKNIKENNQNICDMFRCLAFHSKTGLIRMSSVAVRTLNYSHDYLTYNRLPVMIKCEHSRFLQPQMTFWSVLSQSETSIIHKVVRARF